ncbi:MAG: hypothetical protein GPJ02_12780 [Microcystis aeruginosa G13-12]|nr:hypothetical protein [Microcystis aeruginosa SX13-01]NCS16416.1 hypothetical protein [Microcystis aeruginosa G13-12]NCS19974.1 hypothetical protein [Microcystis aeruginosa G11-06]NCT51490.1 hypothetical protein [Microcystis aeruginosa G13-03]NCT62993.1 hypothetical protein [Microcystis aeruginosa G13-01]
MKYNLMRYWRSNPVPYTLFLDSLPDLLAQVAQKVKQIKDTEQRQNFASCTGLFCAYFKEGSSFIRFF